jgi:hypothetical protein
MYIPAHALDCAILATFPDEGKFIKGTVALDGFLANSFPSYLEVF